MDESFAVCCLRFARDVMVNLGILFSKIDCLAVRVLEVIWRRVILGFQYGLPEVVSKYVVSDLVFNAANLACLATLAWRTGRHLNSQSFNCLGESPRWISTSSL